MRVLLDGAKRVAEGVWLLQLPPDELRVLGTAPSSMGPRSVLLVSDALYDDTQGTLEFEHARAQPLNAGFSAEAVAIDAGRLGRAAHAEPDQPVPASSAVAHGPGDREFLHELERLVEPLRAAGRRLLDEVRREFPGDLKRGQRLNFANTPDNFWYVIVQPRAQSLSITVRGLPSRFGPSSLDLKSDRGGYTRFLVEDAAQVDEAIQIVKRARRKG